MPAQTLNARGANTRKRRAAKKKSAAQRTETPQQMRSRIMSSIRSKNTGIERMVFAHLRANRIWFRRHVRSVPGSPDICRIREKKAVFIDGDFWHGYRYPQWKHKLPSQFWRDKIEKNRARDRRNFAKLRRRGWRVVRVWGHELRFSRDVTLRRVADFMLLP